MNAALRIFTWLLALALVALPVVAVVNGWKQGHGAVLAKHADEITGMAYKPMLIGPDFLRKSGLLVEWGIYSVE